MSFEALQAKVARAEDALEARERQVAADFRVFGGCWRDTWSPPRIMVAGLAAGFLAGWAQPGRAIAGVQPARWLQLATSLAGLAGTVHAAFAASDAKEAAEDAGDAAAVAGGMPPGAKVPADVAAAARASAAATAAATAVPAAVPPAASPMSPSARRYVPDPSWESPPRPAEAATEVSERR
ncbi:MULTISPECIES: protein sip-5 [unclassified Luteimonas]|uniref:protein sip-5 n=1 Tax=unclassified Luteimonas TaxID=2629088 RepID=UPI0018F07F2F|nr:MULTISPECIES: protein sip-5 [unclassified Luteimonas]MBJ6978910.1 protein sip-5 [Luteimonas sp. MC1895]MBJ6984951.1 protein sip-5 [Luteimonas sp. MC1750]QQO05625.1 protein sip-5 [Luteimonas sp. MC1750]